MSIIYYYYFQKIFLIKVNFLVPIAKLIIEDRYFLLY